MPGPAPVGIDLLIGVSVGYDPGKEELFLDRPRPATVTVPDVFAGRWIVPYRTDTALELRLLIDNCTLEVFVDDGAATFTAIIYPEEETRLCRGFGDGSTAGCRHQSLAPLPPPPQSSR